MKRPLLAVRAMGAMPKGHPSWYVWVLGERWVISLRLLHLRIAHGVPYSPENVDQDRERVRE